MVSEGHEHQERRARPIHVPFIRLRHARGIQPPSQEQSQQHCVLAADFLDVRRGSVLACTACGAYAWQRRVQLARGCKRRNAGQSLRRQLEKFAAGTFPGHKDWLISEPRSPTEEELAWLRGEGQLPPRGAAADQALPAAQASLQGLPLMKAFGLESDTDLRVWAARGRLRRPGSHVPGDAVGSHADDAISCSDAFEEQPTGG